MTPSPNYLASLAKENDDLRRENMFLRRQLRNQSMAALMQTLNDYRKAMAQSIAAGQLSTGHARLLNNELTLIPYLTGSLNLDGQHHDKLSDLAKNISKDASRLVEHDAALDPELARRRLQAVEVSCAVCHLNFGGPSIFPEHGLNTQ